ncbi:MAG: hypothetical protein LQ341_001587 [Variospora aurantia]|nr:MAG: hypothetical protein LQ341_001587 [Variospora aurantia]
MDLRFSVIPFGHVEKAQRLFKETFGEHQDLNTNGHSLEAIKAALPSREQIPPDPVQPWVLLGPCLKDSLVGRGPVKDSEDLWKPITTSMRAAAGIQAMTAANSYEPVYLYLLKWNDKMQPGLEYRVFCAPEIMRITAISQYRWFEKWYHSGETWQRQNEIAKRVLENAKVIHQHIMMHPAMNDELKRRGFVFDILEDPDNDNAACLIELNEFGAMSGCGSCLFH